MSGYAYLKNSDGLRLLKWEGNELKMKTGPPYFNNFTSLMESERLSSIWFSLGAENHLYFIGYLIGDLNISFLLLNRWFLVCIHRLRRSLQKLGPDNLL